ncbi:MAG: hypothetical protein LBD79_07245 [Treponema sp.]|jgi:hypothetical protein|nr:hypothetical protein [Treponema sp.]
MKLGKQNVFFLIVAIFVLLLCGVFLFRAPVLLVTDAPFDALYGRTRALLKRVEASLRLFRRVMPVSVSVDTGSDVVAFMVEEAAWSPYLVLFPYRYLEGARRYAEAFPETPVFVLGGRSREKDTEFLGFVSTDSATDFYRAGLCAALIAFDSEQVAGEVLLFQGDPIPVEWSVAFLAGLQEKGFEREPKYLSVTEDYSDTQNVVCVVMSGQATTFLERNLNIPVILFSWVDPALTSQAVTVIFDDSPWALLIRVARTMGKEGTSLPSEMLFPTEKMADRKMLKQVRDKMFN